jgi:broad specificity phosphatase PhoE
MGAFEGKHRDDFYRARKISGLGVTEFRPEGGENYHDVRKRAREFVEKLEEHKGKNILVISHGMINRTIIAELAGMGTEESAGIEQENACVNVIEIGRDGNRLTLLNDCSHLY